jgi:hypothetical protein
VHAVRAFAQNMPRSRLWFRPRAHSSYPTGGGGGGGCTRGEIHLEETHAFFCRLYWLHPESIEGFIEGQAFSRSYYLAPRTAPSLPFPLVSSTSDTQKVRERETTCSRESGVGEEPKHTSAKSLVLYKSFNTLWLYPPLPSDGIDKAFSAIVREEMVGESQREMIRKNDITAVIFGGGGRVLEPIKTTADKLGPLLIQIRLGLH